MDHEQVDLEEAIDRALEAARLRAGDSLGGTPTAIVEDREPSAVETGDLGDGPDGD